MPVIPAKRWDWRRRLSSCLQSSIPVLQFLKNFILPLLDSRDGLVLLCELRPHYVPKRLVFLSQSFSSSPHVGFPLTCISEPTLPSTPHVGFPPTGKTAPAKQKVATPVPGLDPWWHQHAAGCQTTDAARPLHLSSCWTAPSSPRTTVFPK